MKPREFHLWTWLLPLIGAVVVLACWQGAIAIFDIKPYLLPSPRMVLSTLIDERDSLLHAALRTGSSALLGFACAVAGGAIVAVALASSRIIKAALYPWVLVLQMVPVVVMVPIFVIWFGSGLPSIIAISFVISFFPVVASTTLGLVSTDRALIDLFEILEATKAQEIFQLRLPSALPHFLTGVKIAATLAPIGAISGEFLAGTTPDTLGYIIIYCRGIPGKTPDLFAVALVTCAMGFLFVATVQGLSWLLLRHWHDSATSKEA